jgi:tripartite-type tricarboxylate transporter receptor subunit TctC
VESRTGAGGNIATQAVVGAAPDGYTLLTIVTTNAINVTLYEKLDFDFLHDIVPIAGVFRLPMVLLVNPSFPAATLPEFIAYAKAIPGKINIASPGIGTPMHVGIELLKLMAGIDSWAGGGVPGSFCRPGASLYHHGVDRYRTYQSGQSAAAGG